MIDDLKDLKSGVLNCDDKTISSYILLGKSLCISEKYGFSSNSSEPVKREAKSHFRLVNFVLPLKEQNPLAQKRIPFEVSNLNPRHKLRNVTKASTWMTNFETVNFPEPQQ